MAQTKSILTANQQKLLSFISKNKDICRDFYLTGGTALAEFYLKHRLSEDLDFFSEQEVNPQGIFVFLKTIKKLAGISKVDFESSYNRNLFFLYLEDGDLIKTEFTFFPFERIETGQMFNGLSIDSLVDIAVNKLFTVYQKPRSRDFIDLYLILQKNNWQVADLIKKAKIKFDWHIDFVKLGSQFLQVKTLKDFPRMIEKISDENWQNFFIEEANGFKKEIFS